MTLKAVVPVYQVFNSTTGQAMTGTAVLTSLPTEITRKDNVAYELSWSGTPTGTFVVQGSVSYNPGTPQSGGAVSAGVWTTLVVTDQNGNAPVASGAAGQILMNLNELSFPWVRVQYANTSGSGTLSGYVSGKSIGL